MCCATVLPPSPLRDKGGWRSLIDVKTALQAIWRLTYLRSIASRVLDLYHEFSYGNRTRTWVKAVLKAFLERRLEHHFSRET